MIAKSETVIRKNDCLIMVLLLLTLLFVPDDMLNDCITGRNGNG